MILLFLFGVKKKKLTKRKNTGFRFEAAPEQFSSKAQELASLKQPALLFAEIHSCTFRIKTKAGFFISSNPCKMHDSNNSSKQSSLFVRIYSYTFRIKTEAGTFCLFKRFPTVRFRKSGSNRREYRVVRTCHIPFRKGCKLPTYRQRTSAAWQ